MPIARLLTAALCCAFAAPAAIGQVTDFTNWDFYYDNDPGPGPLQDATTGSATTSGAELNFLDDEDVPASYDIGHSSVNANTAGTATTGYYFDRSSDFTIALNFDFTVKGTGGIVGIGLGIGEDRAGVNSAGVALGIDGSTALFAAAARNDDATVNKFLSNPFYTPATTSISGGTIYSGSMTITYDASAGSITVGAGGVSGTELPDSPQTTATFLASDLDEWNNDDLLVSIFLRSGDPFGSNGWTGTSAEADFLNFTVVEGNATQVPEPNSLALLGLGLGLIARRRR